ncbi:IS5 family transposase ISRhosp9 [Streptosporangium roseum]|uniref:transposase family protein n=1 Tax=Streptosporangium roseum TaxID=2001 RepID=UPI00309BF4F1
MITYVATLDVPRHVVDYLSRLLAAHRRRIGTPRGSRALGPFHQAVLVLRWLRERGCVHCLARDVGVSQATGYRYLHEGIDVLAEQAPNLHEVLERCRREGMSHVILDGTLIESDRLAGVRENGNDLWFSQKHKAFGGNVQFLSAPNGTPLWVSDVEPGSTPDITAARIHALPALYKAAADGLPPLADKGYIGAGIGILIPVRRPKGQSEQALHADTRTTNSLIRGIHALGERAAAELKQRWRTLQHVTVSPSRIGDIARAALVLNQIWK